MEQQQGPWPGRFVWHDLMTTDAAKSQQFYTSLFDWQIQSLPSPTHTYHMIVAGPGPVGGIVEDSRVTQPHWMPYIAVADVDQTAAQAAKLGGKVCMPGTDIPETGRFAVLSDPQGAYFSVYQGLPSSPGYDPDQPVEGRICWNELLSTDDQGAQRFYGQLFGWKEQTKDMGPMGLYRVQLLKDKQAGGIMRNPAPGAPSLWLVYFLTSDLRRATERAKKLGANALVENMPIPEIGSFSMFTDPQGAAFALFAMG
jgi:predicted enzyme related to lactoylglutathione lyase